MQRSGATNPSALRQRLMRSACLSMLISSAPFGLAAAHAASAPALPTRGSVAAGAATITGSGSNLQINQSSSRAVIDWSSFSIGQGASVNFANGSGATLNRVLSGGPISALDGSLTGTGSVYLINPAGVIVGKTGVIKVGGTFVASTQDIPDGAFMAGGALNFAGNSQASVINYGRIGALGGDVVLIASQVSNQGQISAPNGAVGMLAGYQVLLKDQADADGKFAVLVGGSNTSVTNAGAINAAAAELRAEQGNIYALAGNTSGVIRATQVAGAGGDIRLVAPEGTVQVAPGAVLDASANGAGDGGHILVDSANTTFAGAALARGGANGGDGGLIETSGTQVNFTGARIDTTAVAGKTGEWLVDPIDLTIDTSNNATLSADLATTSVVLTTTSSSASSTPSGIGTTSSGAGDINIDAPVSWSSPSTLTLNAYHSIYINAPVTISGSGANAGKLVMTTNAAATDGDLFFGAIGSVQFTGATNGLAGHVSLNGTGFTLETSVANLIAAINGGLSGDYALATSVTASGTLNGNQIAAPALFGASGFVGTPFTGTLEGLGNTITNLNIHDITGSGNGGANEIFTGLIGYVAWPGVVRDIGIVSATVNSVSGASSVGALVGYNNGSVINSWSSGTVQGMDVGGLVGTNGGGGLISGSHSSATVSPNVVASQEAAGGLVGANGDGLSNANPAGGATAITAIVTQSYATGAVNDGGLSNGAIIGGLVGWNGPFGANGIISRSYATGPVTSTGGGDDAGGLVGDNNDTVIDSYATGAVTASGAATFAGGLAGQNDFNLLNVFSTGKVTVSNSATGGGVIGLDDSALDGIPPTVTVKNVYYDSTVNSTLPGVGENDMAVGAGPNVTVTGLSTAVLQGGTLPTGFNTATSLTTAFGASASSSATAWTALSGVYPVLNFQYPHGAIAITGNVFTGYDTGNAGAGLTVALSSYGSILGTTQTNGSGAYVLVADAGQQSEVLLSGNSSHANTYLGTPTGATTGNLYEGYLRLPSASIPASDSLLATLTGVGLAAGTNSGADYFYNANSTPGILTSGADIDLITSGAFTFDTSLSTGSGVGQIVMTAGGAVTQTAGAITTQKLLMQGGASASYSLTATGNAVNEIAGNTGAVTLTDTTALTIASIRGQTIVGGLTAAGAVSLSTTGNLAILDAINAGTNNNVTLSLGGTFTNTVGSGAIVVGGTGRWLIYGAAPQSAASYDALNSNNTAIWGTAAGTPITASGNRYVFSQAQTLTFTSTSDSKTYGNDATSQIQTDFSVSGLHAALTGVFLADTAATAYAGAPSLSSAGTAANASVAGGPYAINVGLGTLTSPGGYTFSFADTGALTVNPLAIGATLTGPITKVYDSTTNASLASGDYTLDGILAADASNLGLTASSGAYTGKDVGTNLGVTFSGLSLTGSAASNYDLSIGGFTGNVGVITPATLAVALVGTVIKTYNGTTATGLGAGNYTLSGVFSGDSVTLNGPTSGTFDTKDVGTGKTVTASGLTLSGAQAGDYTVVSAISSNIGQIIALDITASLTGPVSKVYDGTTAASLASGGYTLNGIVAADAADLGLTASTGVYGGKDVGTGLSVGFSGLSLTGSAASNYSLGTTGIGGLVGVITPLSISASLTGPISKVYDGTTAASLAGGYTLNGIVSADAADLGLTASTGVYGGKDVGTGLAVNFSGLALSGSAAGDYSLSTAAFSGNVGVITPLALTASLIGNVTKTYDRTTDASLSGANYTLSASLGSDVVSLVPVTSGTYDTKDVGTGKTVSVTGLALTGANANDYTLASSSLSGAVGIINPLALTASLVGSVTKTYDGTTDAALTSGNYVLSGVILGDSVALNDPSSGAYDTKDAGTGKTVTVTGLALAGPSAGDYTIASSSLSGAVGVINPLALTASLIGSVTKTYDGATDASLSGANYTLSATIGSDVVSLVPVTSGTYDTKDAGTGKTVSVTGLALTGANANDYTVASNLSGAIGTINPLALTASLVGSVTKTYDGTTDASLSGANYTLSASIGSDVVSLVPVTSGAYDTKDAGTGKTVSVSGLVLTGANANDYTVASNLSGAIGVINPLALTASLIGSVTKTYDGATDASLSGANYTLSASIGSDVVSLVPVTSGTYDTKDVGTGKTVSVTGLALTGANANDYTVASNLSGAIGVINPLALTASLIGSVTKTYDGTTAAALTSGNYSLSGVVLGDSVALNDPTSGTYDTKDAGTGKTVSVTGVALIGADANDYSIASNSLSGATGTITAKALTASLTGTVSKTYDGTTTASLASGNYSLIGVVSGDSVALNDPISGTYDTKDAGTGKTVTVNGVALTGAAAGDYSIASSSLSGAIGTITAKALTASLTGTVSKTYDGTTDATLTAGNYSLTGVVSGDSVALNDPISGTYDTKDAGTGKTVTAGGLALSGAQAGDYSIASSVSGAVGTITAKALTASLAGTVSKTYDGTTTATLASGNYGLSGVISGDSVALNDPTSGTYDTKDVGTGKTVTVGGLALSGAQANDYTVAGSVSGAVGTITPLALTARLTGTVSKTYDGTTDATLTAGNYVLAGLISGDSVALNDPTSGTYDTKDAGTGKTVTVGGLALSGAQAGDYTIAGTTSGAVGTITPLALTARLTGTVSKTYDGTTTASLAAGDYVLAGLISGDSVGLNDPTSGVYDTKDAGTGKTVTVGGLALTGAQAGDYTVASTVSAPIGTITPLALTARLTGTVSKTYDGTNTASLAAGDYILAGLISGDSVALNDPASGTYDTKDAGTGKTVTVTGLALTGAQAGDYTVTGNVSGAIGTITPLALTASLTGTVSKTYDGTTAATLTAGNYVLAGLISGDSVALNDPTSGAYDTKDVGTGKTVTVGGLALTGAQAGDYSVVSTISGAVGVITPLALTASVSANNKVYDGGLADTGSASLNPGVVSGDQVAIDGATFSFATAGAGVNKTVAVSGLALSGADAGDYTLSFPSSAAADITQRPITIAADNLTKLAGLSDPPLTYTVESGSIVSDDAATGALARAPGNGPGTYDIGQGSLSLSSNYALTFISGLFTILPPATGLSAFAPANGNSFNASNGASSFSTGLTNSSNGSSNSGTPAPSGGGSGGGQGGMPGAPPVVLLQSSGSGQTNAPYPDNRYVSDNIRFTIGMNP